nr:hypothetical protein [Tanacetum cinerariifolium]
MDTPMVEKSKLDEDRKGKSVDPSHYRGMIGTLLYLTASRPDLQFAICMCAQYQAQPTEKHHLHMWITLDVKYGFESCDPVDTPMVEKSKLDEDKEGKAVDPSHYRARGKMARSKNVYHHKIGRGGYVFVKEKIIENIEIEADEEPSHSIIWLKGRVNKDGEFTDDEIRSIGDKHKEADDKIMEGTLKLNDGNDSMTVVFGKEKGGYARGVGSEVTYKSQLMNQLAAQGVQLNLSSKFQVASDVTLMGAYEVDGTQSSVLVHDKDARIQKKSNRLVTSGKASVRGTRSSSDTSRTPPTTAAGPRLTTSQKGKQAAKTTKAKSLSALFEVAMTEAQQLKLVTKRSLQQTHISQASSSGADEGTGCIPGVPDQYPHNLLKPLPLISNNRGRRVIPFDHFINNDLEYLRGGASSYKYTNSVTKTKAADYGHIKWIEDLVPSTIFAVNWESARDVYSKCRIIAVTDLKIVEWHNYKHLDLITVRRDDDKLYKFKEGDFKRLRIQDIEDMLLLLVQGKITNLTVEERFAFNISFRMFTRSIVIQRRVEDLQLGVESYQKKLNLTKPDTYRSDLKRKEAYIAYSNLRGFIYQNKDKQNRLMRVDKLHKFSDGTLTDIRTALDDRLKGIHIKYMPQTIWWKSDKERAAAMI